MRRIRLTIPEDLESTVEFLSEELISKLFVDMLKERLAGKEKTQALPSSNELLEQLQTLIQNGQSVQATLPKQYEEPEYKPVIKRAEEMESFEETGDDDMDDILASMFK